MLVVIQSIVQMKAVNFCLCLTEPQCSEFLKKSLSMKNCLDIVTFLNMYLSTRPLVEIFIQLPLNHKHVHTQRQRVLTAQFYNPVPRRLQKTKIVSKLPQLFNVARTFSAVKLVSLSVSLVRLPTWIDFRRLHHKQFVI